jgi:hypothetical protein
LPGCGKKRGKNLLSTCSGKAAVRAKAILAAMARLDPPFEGEAGRTYSFLDSSRMRNVQYGRAHIGNGAVQHVIQCPLCYLPLAPEGREAMAEKLVLVGVIPEIVVIGPAEQVVWLSDAANLKIEFDPNRCPFQSNVFQAPQGRQLQSGPPRPGTNPGSYKYRLWMNDQPIGHGEVILREK